MENIKITKMGQSVKGEALARACAKAADDCKAENIQLWDLRGLSSITDFVVLCSGSSMPHLRAIMRDVAAQVTDEHEVKPALSEGNADSRWVVLAYIDVMVHVMHAELRSFYCLEELWAKATPLEWNA